jgi:hypothetical protein
MELVAQWKKEPCQCHELQKEQQEIYTRNKPCQATDGPRHNKKQDETVQTNYNRILLFTLMRIQILFLVKLMRICVH